jgi:hypothetical protein
MVTGLPPQVCVRLRAGDWAFRSLNFEVRSLNFKLGAYFRLLPSDF